MWNIFQKKSNSKSKRIDSAPIADTSFSAVTKIRENISRQEKREEHLNDKISKITTLAKTKMSKGDKRGAIFCMKQKKLYEQELQKIDQVKMTLETQAINLESASANVETYNTMKSGNGAMKKIRKVFGIDDVDKLMDETRDEMELHHEVEHAFSQPIDPLMAADEDELLAELNALEAEDARESTSFWPTTPSKKPVSATSSNKPTKSKFALFA